MEREAGLKDGSGKSEIQEDLYAVRARARAGETELGLRQRHKIDKLQRITDAAELLFGRDGYDGTTLREIAKEAEVALGTLSLYASDKRELILLLFNKMIPPLIEQGRSRTSAKNKLADNMVTYFSSFYEAYSKNLTLYRIVLGYGDLARDSSVHTREFDRTRVVILTSLGDLILRARANGECSAKGDVELQARSFFYLYFASVRRWISLPDPSIKAGLAELKALFELHVNGMKI